MNAPMKLTHNTLSESLRLRICEGLGLHLAAAIDLTSQIKQAHWNVRGPGFYALHTLFDKVAETIETYADALAERIGTLGETAHGTIAQAAKRTFLIPYPLGIANESEHVFAVSSALAAFSQSVREAVAQATELGDAATADLYTEILRGTEQQLWFVESQRVPT